MAHVTLVDGPLGTIQWMSGNHSINWNGPTSLKFSWCSGILAGTNLNLYSPKKKKNLPPYFTREKKMIHGLHSIWEICTLSDGKVPQPWWWWTWCTGWRLPHDHWLDSWGLLPRKTLQSGEKLNPWISQKPLEEMTANTAENQHVYLEFFRKKMTCRAGFWSVLEANPSGIKKGEKHQKNKVEGKKTKQIPSIIPLGAQTDSWQFGRTLPSVHSHSQRSVVAKIISLQHLAKVEITSSGYCIQVHSRREAISGHKKQGRRFCAIVSENLPDLQYPWTLWPTLKPPGISTVALETLLYFKMLSISMIRRPSAYGNFAGQQQTSTNSNPWSRNPLVDGNFCLGW